MDEMEDFKEEGKLEQSGEDYQEEFKTQHRFIPMFGDDDQEYDDEDDEKQFFQKKPPKMQN